MVDLKGPEEIEYGRQTCSKDLLNSFSLLQRYVNIDEGRKGEGTKIGPEHTFNGPLVYIWWHCIEKDTLILHEYDNTNVSLLVRFVFYQPKIVQK